MLVTKSGNSRLNMIYAYMKQRCCNPRDTAYEKYGGRGITICKEWIDTVVVKTDGCQATKGWLAFKKWALANGYTDELSIDRIDNNKGYSPDNCRWVNRKVQNNNKGNNIFITYKGECKSLSQWCEELHLPYQTIFKRYKHGCSVSDMFEKRIRSTKRLILFNGKTQSVVEWSKELGINYATLRARLNEYGWSVEKAFKTKEKE